MKTMDEELKEKQAMSLYRIILVDDEEEVRKGIIRKIDWSSLGFEVVGDAENGAEALERIEQLEPEVVMTDIRMPFMDGLTLTEKERMIATQILNCLFVIKTPPASILPRGLGSDKSKKRKAVKSGKTNAERRLNHEKTV